MYTHTIIPNQRVSFAEKTKNDYELMKRTMDAIINNFYAKNVYYDNNSKSYRDRDYNRKLSNYMLFNNQINQEDFIREINQHGFSEEIFKGKIIQPYNKAPNKIHVLLGEELARPKKFRSVSLNAEGINMKLIEQEQEIRQFIDEGYNKLRNFLNNFVAQQPNQDPEQLEKMLNELVESHVSSNKLQSLKNKTALSRIERICNRWAKALMRNLNIVDKSNDGFKHSLIAGEEIVWTGVHKNKLDVRVINTISSIYDKNENVKWIDEGRWAGEKRMKTASEIISDWGNILNSTQLIKFEDRNSQLGRSSKRKGALPYPPDYDLHKLNSMVNMTASDFGQYGPIEYADDMYEEIHLEWKSLQKVYFVKYTNEYGAPDLKIVSEDFLIPEYATVKTQKIDGVNRKIYLFDEMEAYETWIEQLWEGVRIGADVYVNIQPVEYQYRSMEDPYSTRLRYTGVVTSNMNAPAVSMMDRMKPFIYLFLIVAHRLKEFIAQDRAPLTHFDITMVDPKIGPEKTLYYMDQLNIDIYNPLMNAEKPGAQMRGGKVTNATQRSTMQHINNYIALLAAIDEHISDVAGVTKQREGQTSQYEAVGNNQQAIIRSSLITRSYFYLHDLLWERVMNNLMNIALKYNKGKRILTQYITDQLDVAILDILPEDLSLYDIGIVMSNAVEDEEMFNKIEQLTQYMLSSDKAQIEDVIALYESRSISELKESLIEIERNRNRANEMAAKQQQEIISAEAQAKKDLLTHEYELKEKLMRIDNESKEKLKEMDVFKYQRELDSDSNNVPDHLEVDKFKLEERKHNDEVQLQREKMENDRQIAKQKASTPTKTKK